jgi:hypothetical protein
MLLGQTPIGNIGNGGSQQGKVAKAITRAKAVGVGIEEILNANRMPWET